MPTRKHKPNQLNINRNVPPQPPFRIKGKQNPEYTKWYKRYCEDPLVRRERNRKQAEKTRKKPEWQAYFNAYYREYYKRNKEVLRIRTTTSNIRQSLKAGFKLETVYSNIYENLKKIGWTPELDPKKTVLNHKLSIKLIFDFNPELPRECYFDVDNLELVNKGENNSAAKRVITEETLKVASILEAKYPHWLRGLTGYIMSMRGDLV